MRWIPVEERLPDMDQECLVKDKDGDKAVGYYRYDAKAWDSPNFGWIERKDETDNHEAYSAPCGLGKVVAWKPISSDYEEGKHDKECCRTCRWSSELQRWDYSNVRENGVVKQKMDGFACTAFADSENRVVIQKIGSDIDFGFCEMYCEGAVYDRFRLRQPKGFNL